MYSNKIMVDDRVYDLNYDVTESGDGCYEFSVSKVYCGEIIDKSWVRLAPITFDDIVEMADTMCRNTVTPISFREIVEEMVVFKSIVE